MVKISEHNQKMQQWLRKRIVKRLRAIRKKRLKIEKENWPNRIGVKAEVSLFPNEHSLQICLGSEKVSKKVGYYYQTIIIDLKHCYVSEMFPSNTSSCE